MTRHSVDVVLISGTARSTFLANERLTISLHHCVNLAISNDDTRSDQRRFCLQQVSGRVGSNTITVFIMSGPSIGYESHLYENSAQPLSQTKFKQLS